MKKLYVGICLVLSMSKTNATTSICGNAMGTMEMDECYVQELDKVERRLEINYKKLLSILSKPDDDTYQYSAIKNAVITSQKAWLKLREVDCDAEFTALPQPTGGVAPRIRIHCMIDYTNRRIKRLEAFAPEL